MPIAFSWKAVAIYLALVVWTPIIPMRPLPPLRLDDLWLVYVVARQSMVRAPFRQVATRFPARVFLLTALCSLIIDMARDHSLSVTNLLASLLYFRYVLIAMMVRHTRWNTDDLHRLFLWLSIAITASLPVVTIQTMNFQPLAILTTQLWAGQTDKYLTGFSTLGYLRRSVGTIGNPNYLGFFLWLNVLLSLFLANIHTWRHSGAKRTGQWLHLGIAILSLYLIVFSTASRTAVILSSITVLYLQMMLQMINPRRVSTFLLILLAMSAAGYWISMRPGVLPKRLTVLSREEIASPSGKVWQGGGRWEMWEDRISEITDGGALWLGLGRETALESDNGYLEAILRGGVIILVLILLLQFSALFRVTRMAWRGRGDRYNQAGCAFVSAALVGHAIFETTALGYMHSKTGPLTVVLLTLAYHIGQKRT